MGISGGPYIIRGNNLTLDLDAADQNSYSGSGTAWNDLGENSYNGTLTNSSTFFSSIYSPSNYGSILLDGIDDYVSITNPSNFQAQNFSVSVWVNPTIPSSALTDILDYDHATLPYHGWVLQSEDATTNRYYYLTYYDGSAFQPTTGIGAGKGIQVTNGTWQNITYTKSGTSVIGYLNGVQSVSYTAGNATVSYQSNRNFRIGSVVSGSNPGRVYNGQIANAQVYSRALSAAEVLSNFNEIRPKFSGIGTLPTQGLVAYWDAGNPASYAGVGTTVNDLSGNGNNLTLSSAQYLSDFGGVIPFNGSGTNFAYASSPNLADSPSTVIAASRYSGAERGRMINGYGNNWIMGHWSNSVANYYANAWVTSAGAGGSDTNWRIYAAVGHPGVDRWSFYINNVLNAGPNNLGSQGPSGITIGRGSPFITTEYSVGQFGFLLMYNRELTHGEISTVYNLFRSRYGL